MSETAAGAAARFSAFISYSHADAVFARRLHRRLESYRLPRRLAQGNPRVDPRTRRLAPMFMDRAELIAAPNLTDSVRQGIAGSRTLVVICSPASAKSEWVGREIALFRSLRPDGLVLAALCRGEPAEAFHPELYIGGVDRRDPPIAADFRKIGDGGRLALLKLVAPLAGVGLDQLVHRDAQRRMRGVLAAAATTVAGLALTGGLVALLHEAQVRAEREHARSDQMIDYMIGDERSRLKQIGRLDLLDALNHEALGFFAAQRGDRLTDGDIARRAKLMVDMVDDDTQRGDFTAADIKARDALKATGALMAARPDDPDRVYADAQSQYWFGFVRRREGDAAAAEQGFQAYADRAARLLHLRPANLDYRLEHGYADSDLGTLLLQRSLDVQRAGQLFAAAQADFEAVARARPGDRDMQTQVEDGYAWLAEVRRFAGDTAGAVAYRRMQRARIEALIDSDRRDAQARKALVGNALALGRLAIIGGDWRGAVATLSQAHRDAQGLADQDPENMDAAQQVRAIDLFQVKAMLSAPAAQRSPLARIQALLGDCGADARRPNHVELATFCTILQARLLALKGDPRAAALLAPLRASPLLKGERLSERWLIDWRSEIAIQT